MTVLCFLRVLFQGLPAQVNWALGLLASGYAVPTALALAALVFWFEGVSPADRAANQRVVLRGLLAVLAAWGLAALGGLAWRQALSDPGWGPVVSGWTCWQGVPSPSTAAAIGFALGTVLWRQDWRWGLGVYLVTGLWAGAQVCGGLHYPLDVAVGTLLGAGVAWPLRAAGWLNRPLDALIGLARRWMLA